MFKNLGTQSLSNVSVAYFGHLLAACVSSLLKQMASWWCVSLKRIN